jgi:hypothetical protein
VPAESVYAIFEVKQELDLGNIRYSGDKVATVRKLKRTSAKIVDVGKDVPARTVTPIIGGILTSESAWNPSFGKPFEKALSDLEESQRLDLGIALSEGAFEINYSSRGVESTKIEKGETALLYFFFTLLWRLQKLGTVPAIDYVEYLKIIDRLN